MDFNFEEFQNGLTLEMDKNIQQDLLKRQKEEDAYLLNIKNEKIKQDEINRKKIEDDIKQKELVIKESQDAEIKRNVDNALAIQKQQMISEYENLKNQLIAEHNKQIQTIKAELDISKVSLAGAYSSCSSLSSECSKIEKEYEIYISCAKTGKSYIQSNQSYKALPKIVEYIYCYNSSEICYSCKKFKCKTHIGHYNIGHYRGNNPNCNLKFPCRC